MKKYGERILRVITIMLALIMVASAVNVGTTKTQAKKKKNIVILYFSATGTTKGAAKRIQKTTSGKLIAIKPADPYTEEDLDYSDDNSRVMKEHESADTPAQSTVRPEIANLNTIKKAVKKADVVYIGFSAILA